MGMTMAEKILARAAGKEKVMPDEFVWARIDRTRSIDFSLSETLAIFEKLGIEKVWDPERVMVVFEHSVPASDVAMAETQARARKAVKKFGLKYFYDIGRHGICHQKFVEEGFALPGELVAAIDSHTCTYGALNCAARGIMTEEPYVLATGKLWFRVPETIRFDIVGKLPEMVFSKDVILYMAGKYGTDVALYKSVEFGGPVVEEMSLSSRMTMANMGVEIGAKFALFEADQKTLDYLKGRAKDTFTPVKSDPDAVLEATYVVDVTNLEPQVACPHDVGNVKPVTSIAGTPINQAFLGSCVNGRYEDLEVAAKILRGKKIHRDVRMIVTPASTEVYKQAVDTGLVGTFVNADAVVTNSMCGACGGMALGILASGERCISSTNRNFQGRMGSPQAEVYLASPATVAASAIAGVISDPREYIAK